MKFIFSIGFVLVSVSLFSIPTFAASNKKITKEYAGIISKVNDAIITIEDLKEATRLTELLMMTQPEEASQKKKFIEEVLKEKIHEYLKYQYIKKIASMQKITWVNTKEIDDAFQDVAKRYKMNSQTFEKLLREKNIKKDTLLKKIETDISWVAYINARYRKDVNISDSEAEKIAAEMKDKMTQESFFVSRMFFPVMHQSDDSSVLSHANNIIQLLKKGADFSNVARQFSKSGDAKKGGMLGWIFDGQLSTAEINALKQMDIGSYKIVRNDRGYVILLLQDKKAAGPRTYSNVKFKQIVYPFEKRPDNSTMKQLLDFITDMKKSSKNSKDFMQKATESGVMGVLDEMSGTLENMLPEYRSVIAKVPAGGISNPIITDNGIIIVCVLSKETKTLNTPTAEEIKQHQINERLTALSERELHGLIKKASILINGDYSLGADYQSANK